MAYSTQRARPDWATVDFPSVHFYGPEPRHLETLGDPPKKTQLCFDSLHETLEDLPSKEEFHLNSLGCPCGIEFKHRCEFRSIIADTQELGCIGQGAQLRRFLETSRKTSIQGTQDLESGEIYTPVPTLIHASNPTAFRVAWPSITQNLESSAAHTSGADRTQTFTASAIGDCAQKVAAPYGFILVCCQIPNYVISDSTTLIGDDPPSDHTVTHSFDPRLDVYYDTRSPSIASRATENENSGVAVSHSQTHPVASTSNANIDAAPHPTETDNENDMLNPDAPVFEPSSVPISSDDESSQEASSCLEHWESWDTLRTTPSPETLASLSQPEFLSQSNVSAFAARTYSAPARIETFHGSSATATTTIVPTTNSLTTEDVVAQNNGASHKTKATSAALSINQTPIIEYLYPEIVRVNKEGHRIDIIEQVSAEEKMEQDAIQERKFCNPHFLVGPHACRKGRQHCKLNHDAELSKKDLKHLRTISQMSPCNRGRKCRDPCCVYGHVCSGGPRLEGTGRYGANCSWPNCKFPPYLHTGDRKVTSHWDPELGRIVRV